MTPNLLAQKSMSLFTAMGGWRTIAEGIASRALFLIAYLLTERVVTAGLIAVGGVLVCAVIRVYGDRKYWQAAGPLVVVGLSAALAGSTGQGIDFYLPSLLLAVAGGTVFLISTLVRRPVVGLIVEAASGERSAWWRDRPRLRRYQRCMAVFLAKSGITLAVMVPLYLAGNVVALGIASTLMGAPATGVCAYLSWRILRAGEDSPAPA
ncbi:hypothetical protein DP939_30635 [Spongiactinospora rosea]|uniref:DUF3159 domain-containing protein n=1 Tax=Spongiactinospora rosea TaxID=2248750 RepID=A0A366LQU1_9ACTN|nr:DUF3159 domain-containing protein [Spongiactinospora rosea]RBQ16325.1 hypothetical protein DP939_30635 [Spongiactinospora rosea]